tara:strand:+ start:446 stop:631 length:186 start_codon:yes stop_codon:yes gene_type:complete
MASPCQAICVMSDCGAHCVGCYRTLDEISRWMTYTQEEKKNVVAKIKTRRKLFLGGTKNGG